MVDISSKVFYSNAKTIKMRYTLRLKYLILPNCRDLQMIGHIDARVQFIYAPRLVKFSINRKTLFKDYALLYAPRLRECYASLHNVINLTSIECNDTYTNYYIGVINDSIQFYDDLNIDYEYLYKHSSLVQGFNQTDFFSIDDMISMIENNNHPSKFFNIISKKTRNYILLVLIQFFFTNQKNCNDDIKNLIFNLSLLQMNDIIIPTILATQRPFKIVPGEINEFGSMIYNSDDDSYDLYDESDDNSDDLHDN
jgi:hypothetical protein